MAKKVGSSTRQFVDIADVRGPLVLLKDGSLRALILVESVNFDLKSPDEQTGILRAFQDLLNTLDFPLQIAITSRKLDLSPYLTVLQETDAKLTNELLKTQLQEYGRFVQELIKLANVMEKKFYVVVPYHAIETVKETTSGLFGKLKGIFSAARRPAKLSEEETTKYRSHLEQRLSLILAGLAPLGVKTKILEQDELLATFQKLYNPGAIQAPVSS